MKEATLFLILIRFWKPPVLSNESKAQWNNWFLWWRTNSRLEGIHRIRTKGTNKRNKVDLHVPLTKQVYQITFLWYSIVWAWHRTWERRTHNYILWYKSLPIWTLFGKKKPEDIGNSFMRTLNTDWTHWIFIRVCIEVLCPFCSHASRFINLFS